MPWLRATFCTASAAGPKVLKARANLTLQGKNAFACAAQRLGGGLNPKPYLTHFSSFHFLFHYPYINPMESLYNPIDSLQNPFKTRSFHFLFHYPYITPAWHTKCIVLAQQVMFFWWLNLVRLYSLYKILYPKGGYNLTLYWVP